MHTSQPQAKNQHILVVALSGIGNFIMQSPAISLMKQKFPDSRITVWVAPRGTKILAQNHPAVDEVIEAPIKGSLVTHLAFISQLKKRRFDIGIIMSPGQLIKSAFYLFAAGIPKRIGNSYPFGTNPHSTLFLTSTTQEDESLHDIEQNIHLLKSLDISSQDASITYNLTIPEEAKQKANVWFAKNNLNQAFLVGLHAGCSPDFLWKRWPLPNFATLAKNLLQQNPNAHILLFGGPDEIEQKKELKSLIGSSNVHEVEADLLTTAGIMQACRLVIANDSGLMHLSSAVGTPTLGLFGPTDEKKTGPRGPKSYVLRAPDTKPAYNTEKNYHLGQTAHPTITAITPEQATAKAMQILSI